MILTRELRPLEHYSTLELSIYFNIMKIKLLMSTNVVTVKFDNPISKVKGIFEALGFHYLLVVETEQLFGIISDRDLLKGIALSEGSNKPVGIVSWRDILRVLSKKTGGELTRQA